MTEDREELSPNARKIFELIKRHFPLGPWGENRWTEEGMVWDNVWFDLRKSGDRDRLIEKTRATLGYMVQVTASGFRGKNGSLKGFCDQPFERMIEHSVGLLLLLNDLDVQIATLDIVEGYTKEPRQESRGDCADGTCGHGHAGDPPHTLGGSDFQ